MNLSYTRAATFSAFLEAISTNCFAVVIIEISEFILLIQEPHPIALAPAAKANGAVVGLMPVAVITGISTFLESSIVFESVNYALSIKPLTPLAGCSDAK